MRSFPTRRSTLDARAIYFLRAGACSMAISCCCIAHLALCKRIPRAMLACLRTVPLKMRRNALCSCCTLIHAHALPDLTSSACSSDVLGFMSRFLTSPWPCLRKIHQGTRNGRKARPYTAHCTPACVVSARLSLRTAMPRHMLSFRPFCAILSLSFAQPCRLSSYLRDRSTIGEFSRP